MMFSLQLRRLSLVLLLLWQGVGCKTEETSVSPDEGADCSSHDDCNNGNFCDGIERCAGGVCEKGEVIACDDGIKCTEDTCSADLGRCLFTPPDRDGDGARDAACLGPDSLPLGSDCDDDDADRFPGNEEICEPGRFEHDEDCDAKTFGRLDWDQDTFTDERCCNVDGDDRFCGQDCDDAEFARNAEHPEICDDLDNNCDGKVDESQKDTEWTLDFDGDGFGDPDGDAVLSCKPVPGHSVVSSDCNDGTAAIHPAMVEVCDGVDNDCDSEVDEGGVCGCTEAGAYQACSCGSGYVGVQRCDDQEWDECNCDTCVTGTSTCVGGLLPTQCVNGQVLAGKACGGARPLCVQGECVCLDGTLDCVEVGDILPPLVSNHAPAQGAQLPPPSQLAVVFNEAISPTSVTEDSVVLRTLYGAIVPLRRYVGGSTIVVEPISPLEPGYAYELVVARSVTDLSGNGLPSEFRLSFTTLLGELPVTIAQQGPGWDSGSPVQIAVNARGEAVLLAEDEREILNLYGWSGVDWALETQLTLSVNDAEALAIADSGAALVAYNDGYLPAVHTRDSGVWNKTFVEFQFETYTPSLSAVTSGDELLYAYQMSRQGAPSSTDVYSKSGPDPAMLALSLPIYAGWGEVLAANDAGSAVLVLRTPTQLSWYYRKGRFAQWLPSAPLTLDNQGLTQDQREPVVTMADDGSFTIFYATGSPTITVKGLTVSNEGIPEEPFTVVENVLPQLGAIEVASDATGRYHLLVPSWLGNEIYTGRAGPPTEEFHFDAHFTGISFTSGIAASDGGRAVAVSSEWTGSADRVWVTEYVPSTGWSAAKILVGNLPQSSQAEVAMEPNGRAWIVYQSPTKITTVRY